MIINHMICPRCGHDFYTECSYATCDACNTFFYTSQSKTCNPPSTVSITLPSTLVSSYGEKLLR